MRIIVQAFNRIGPGPQSEEIVGETLINDPPKAPVLTSINVGYNNVELNWSIETMDDSFDGGLHVSSKLDVNEERHINSEENSFKYNNHFVKSISDINI
ncbi:hypothetical protein DERF_009777 [Dermatophagoides farinae]|uniref:Fibronectin type-III domain-containing protein n=1 Tax=Dermatophagoides farinae TaxID=6954 RepID=A0A922HX29_DERFA|nr:hypothetical protein DERF_009777 [Dermatophagoides farinae]